MKIKIIFIFLLYLHGFYGQLIPEITTTPALLVPNVTNGQKISKIISVPDFIILGVTKCGTTSLYRYMMQHPKIIGAHKKELHYFDNLCLTTDITWYNQQFPQKKSPDELTGEATPGYFWKPGCARKIFKHCPQTKLIVIFRNPVKRLISEYFRLVRRGEELLPFDQAILQPRFQKRYLGAGCYNKHLTRWLSFFPKDQILILILEELAASPEKEVNKIFKFLGLEEYKLDSYEANNKAHYDSSEIKPATIEYLKQFYAPHNQQLEEFLGRKLPW